MTLEEYLGVFPVEEKGALSVPLSYRALRMEFERLCAEEPAYQIIAKLEAAGYVSTLSDGRKKLTLKGLRARIPLPTRNVAPSEAVGDERAWDKFRRLCYYYADCVHQSERSQEYLFESDINNKFLFPALPIGWLREKAEISLYFSGEQTPAINRIRTRRDDDEEVYIGYPLSVFRGRKGDLIYTPIILIPVNFSFSLNKVCVKIRHDEINLNRSWVEFNIPAAEQANFISSVCYSEGENSGLLNTEIAVQYLANRYKIELNANHFDLSLPQEPRKLVNKAALFVGNSLQYSKTLKKELYYIAKQPAAVLDKTALGYVFREPPLENKFEREENLFPLDFLGGKSNSEQHRAVGEALNKPVSKVTGPPGTGKSQVAVNLIANLVFGDKSVLFTSKNHKAIHAIWERSREVLPQSLSLLQFCTQPSEKSGNGAVWFKQDVGALVGAAVMAEHGLTTPELTLRSVERERENLQDFHDEILEIEFVRKRMQELAATCECLRRSIPFDDERLCAFALEEIESLCKRIGGAGTERTRLQRFIAWLLRRKQREDKVEVCLREKIPELANFAKTTQRLKERVERLCADVREYRDAIGDLSDVQRRAAGFPNYENLLERLSASYSEIGKCLRSAFVYKRVRAIKKIDDEDREAIAGAQQKLKDAVSYLARANLPFLTQTVSSETHELAQNTFVQFAHYFPAWATTLLSLTKASPCVAALFDRVIIDEASQCEIPPIIPALFRAKGVSVIGDPDQFPPVVTLRENRHGYIRFIKHKLTSLEDEHFDFCRQNAYGIIRENPVFLREHFRCHEEIADYCNSVFYGDKLHVMTKVHFDKSCGFSSGREWFDIKDSLQGELAKLDDIFETLSANNFEGSIGVITPFRKLANLLQTRLVKYEEKLANFSVEQDVNTANGFQGGERDLIVFVLALNSETEKGQEWYATAEENRYIYNVAVSRAKACLLIIGDRTRAQNSTLLALRKLAENPRVKRQKSQSPGEELLYRALLGAGFLEPNLCQQYPLVGRYLDIALVREKIDIEVDGEAFHLNEYGERKADDVFRDLQICAAGWRVVRFWYKEVRDDLSNCVSEIQKLVREKS